MLPVTSVVVPTTVVDVEVVLLVDDPDVPSEPVPVEPVPVVAVLAPAVPDIRYHQRGGRLEDLLRRLASWALPWKMRRIDCMLSPSRRGSMHGGAGDDLAARLDLVRLDRRRVEVVQHAGELSSLSRVSPVSTTT